MAAVQKTIVKNERGLSRFDTTLIIAVVLVIIAIVLLLIWANGSTRKNSNTTTSANNTASSPASTTAGDAKNTVATVQSFAECKKAAGSKMIQTVPAQCITKDGKTFTDKITAVTNGVFESSGSLAIDAWGVQLPIPKSTPGLSYEINAADQMTVVVRPLTTNSCNGVVGTIQRAKTADTAAQAVNGYSYSFVAPAQICSTDSAMASIETKARSDLAQAAKLITAKQ